MPLRQTLTVMEFLCTSEKPLWLAKKSVYVCIHIHAIYMHVQVCAYIYVYTTHVCIVHVVYFHIYMNIFSHVIHNAT